MISLSVILPIYKVEKYIRPCLESIFRQGLSDNEFEVILVNDGTPDNSIGIIDDIINQHNNIVVVNQSNKGVSHARNTGLAKAQGTYVYFVDPDDLVVDNCLSVLLPKAILSNADVLLADFVKFSDDEDPAPLIHVENRQCKDELKNAADAYIEDLSPAECYIWRMFLKRDFLINKQIDFKPFRYEDTLFCQECLLKAKTCLRVYTVLYAYRLRRGSFTSSMDLSGILDLNSSLTAISHLRDIEGLPKNAYNRLMNNIFAFFYFDLWCIAHNKNLYAERNIIISDLKAKIGSSDFVFKSDFKQRLVTFMFWNMPNFYLKIRTIL